MKKNVRNSLLAMGIFCSLYAAEKPSKEPEFIGPQPAIRQVQPSSARRIVKCGSDIDAEGLDAVVFVIGLFIAGAAMSLGR